MVDLVNLVAIAFIGNAYVLLGLVHFLSLILSVHGKSRCHLAHGVVLAHDALSLLALPLLIQTVSNILM